MSEGSPLPRNACAWSLMDVSGERSSCAAGNKGFLRVKSFPHLAEQQIQLIHQGAHFVGQIAVVKCS